MNPQKKPIYGLVGYPLGHSLSPLMHNAAFEALGVDAVYQLFPLKEEELEAFFAELAKKDSEIFGLNVTVPYKEKVLKYLHTLSPFVQKIKAVNTIVIKKDRTLTGYNTDGPGFLTHIKELGFETENKRIAILGAGGAARAILSVLCLIPEKPGSVKLYDIDTQKSRQLCQDLTKNFDVNFVRAVDNIDDLNIESADLLVNATPLGMKKEDPPLLDENLLHKNMLVYDLIYNPQETDLLKKAKNKGARTSNGLGMLFYQGVLAFQHWADIELGDDTKKTMWDNLLKGINS